MTVFFPTDQCYNPAESGHVFSCLDSEAESTNTTWICLEFVVSMAVSTAEFPRNWVQKIVYNTNCIVIQGQPKDKVSYPLDDSKLIWFQQKKPAAHLSIFKEFAGSSGGFALQGLVSILASCLAVQHDGKRLVLFRVQSSQQRMFLRHELKKRWVQ